MAYKYNKSRKRYNNIFYTLIAVVLMCLVLLTMINSVYNSAEEDGFEDLHTQTRQFKDDIVLQINSDMENLSTMARLAASLYAEGEDFHVILESFESIGLIKDIGILTPDNEFITRVGSLEMNGSLDFYEEYAKGKYISGRVKDITNADREVIRNAVPIISDDKAVGILYGIIDLNDLKARYYEMANDLDAQLYVYESGNGNFVIDTFHNKLGNISELETVKFRKGYSYDLLITGGSGYSSFESRVLDEELYVHYAPLGISDWQIMLARPEGYVFETVHSVSRVLLSGFALIAIVMVLYAVVIFRGERRMALSTAHGSKIRKLLLGINQHHDNIAEAMEQVTVFAKSRSAFFVDTDGKDSNYVLPEYAEQLLRNDDRKYFTAEVLKYAADIHSLKKSALSIMSVTTNKHLVKTNPDFYDFLVKHNIKNITFAAITDENNHISVLGVVNPRRKAQTMELLQDIAVCFSIAIFNKNHLNKTEAAATTDALTGVSNRVTYKKDLMRFDGRRPDNFACVFIDVNELHLHNNKYGHAAGDEMLLYIANTLKEVFYGNYIYRMGGDEFLIFAENADKDAIKEQIETLKTRLKPMNYHVAIGMSYRSQNTNTEEMVRDAEKRMYEAKAMYYQNKESTSVSSSEDKGYDIITTGIKEIDGLLAVMQEHYHGIYRVALDTDEAQRILMPAYLGYNEKEQYFSRLLTKYINETVNPDFHRAMMSFLNYDAIKRQILEGNIPKITYKKVNGETVILSVYALETGSTNPCDTLWVFSKA